MRCSDNGLLDLINDLPTGIDMVEVGCYAGESTLMFLQSGKIKTLHAIDPWCRQIVEANDDMAMQLNSMYDSIKAAEQSFLERVKGFDVHVQKCIFTEAELPLVDFVYIDANHTYESVKADIALALKILKPNGIIAGHDYYDEFQGVIKAVNEFRKPDKVYKDTSWLIRL